MYEHSERPPPLFDIGERVTVIAGQCAGRRGVVLAVFRHPDDPLRDKFTVDLECAAGKRKTAHVYPPDLKRGVETPRS